MPEQSIENIDFKALNQRAISKPLVTHIYTADPSAHVFNGKLYIYPSHDVESNVEFDDLGSHFAMEDYHVISLDSLDSEAIDHGVALHVNEVPWANQQMWAPDANEKDGKFYLFFPAKDHEGIFRIGVAISDSPTGPFVAEKEAIKGSFSIDPAVFKDDDGAYYMYFGGIWGGQLQRWREGKYKAEGEGPLVHLPQDNEPALCPKIAKMSNDLLAFAHAPRDVEILDAEGNLLLQGDIDRRFFEAAWLHKYREKYYFSYSTGDSHFICYAAGDNPYGPFTYTGRILEPVIGWTSHHSICEFENKWYLFYHDSSLSEGITHLRSIKMAEIIHQADGTIKTLNPYA